MFLKFNSKRTKKKVGLKKKADLVIFSFGNFDTNSFSNYFSRTQFFRLFSKIRCSNTNPNQYITIRIIDFYAYYSCSTCFLSSSKRELTKSLGFCLSFSYSCVSSASLLVLFFARFRMSRRRETFWLSTNGSWWTLLQKLQGVVWDVDSSMWCLHMLYPHGMNMGSFRMFLHWSHWRRLIFWRRNTIWVFVLLLLLLIMTLFLFNHFFFIHYALLVVEWEFIVSHFVW